MTIIEQIKAEIERRIKILREDEVVRQNCTSDFLEGKIYGYEEIISLLSTLESEKPMQEGLDEEIESYWKENGPMSHAEYDRLAKCARHFAQWGAEHFRDLTKMISGSSEIPKDLEEASSKFATHTAPNGVSVEFIEEKLSFQEGAKWAREQMMKDGLDAVKSGQPDKIEKTIAGVFVKYGMDHQKELIMKNAKDGWIDEECVIILNDGTLVDLQPDYEKKPAFEFEYAQDVRVIVLPKENGK